MKLPIIKKKEVLTEDDKYELTKKVSYTDIKGYLQNEYERANEREDYILELEEQLNKARELELKYNAMLVVQEKTTERTKKQDEEIKNLKKELNDYKEKVMIEKSKQTDIKFNAEEKLKEKDKIIKELKAQQRKKASKSKGE